MLPMTNFGFKQSSMLCLTFPENSFNFVTQKFAKRSKSPFPNAHNIPFLTSRQLQNYYVKCFLWLTLNLNSFDCFASLSQKTVSISSLKNLQKIEKCHFKMLGSFLTIRQLQNHFRKCFLEAMEGTPRKSTSEISVKGSLATFRKEHVENMLLHLFLIVQLIFGNLKRPI